MVQQLVIQTARFAYAGADRLDVTVKSAGPEGRPFAPTWDLVNGARSGRISWDEYTARYRKLMRERLQADDRPWRAVLERQSVTLLCYCRDPARCHRTLLAGYLAAYARSQDRATILVGEWRAGIEASKRQGSLF